jgi:hypothetical protein
MNLDAFKASLTDPAPPEGLAAALRAMWQDANDNWDAAHKLAQSQDDATGAWVHAYLHRVEGDESNAGHWYRRAAKPHSKAPLSEEWEEIVTALLVSLA